MVTQRVALRQSLRRRERQQGPSRSLSPLGGTGGTSDATNPLT